MGKYKSCEEALAAADARRQGRQQVRRKGMGKYVPALLSGFGALANAICIAATWPGFWWNYAAGAFCLVVSCACFPMVRQR